MAAGFQEGARHLRAFIVAKFLQLSDYGFLACNDPLEGDDMPLRLLKSDFAGQCPNPTTGFPKSNSGVSISIDHRPPLDFSSHCRDHLKRLVVTCKDVSSRGYDPL